jgi:hypothetical protein
MPQTKYTPAEIGRIGTEIYRRQLRFAIVNSMSRRANWFYRLGRRTGLRQSSNTTTLRCCRWTSRSASVRPNYRLFTPIRATG